VLHELPRAGSKHPRVHEYLRLKRRPSSRAERTVAIEGALSVRAARAASVRLEVVFVCPALARHDDSESMVTELLDARTAVLTVGEALFHRMTDRDGPDGFAAIGHMPAWRLQDVAVTDASCVVVAADIETAGNLGTLIRTADGAGASAVIVTGGRIRATHPLVVRASIGTAFTMPVVEADPIDVVAWLRRHKFLTVAADPSATRSHRDVSYRRPFAVVVGNERLGLGDVWHEAADAAVAIPMLGTADSLNVAVACALVLYEASLRTSGH
jgi:TrmH family RNA methyltransferase